MYEVKVVCDFSASHRLRDYGGKCENVHGHNWAVEVICQSEKLDNIGLVIDFKVLKEKVCAILQELDHTDLNTIGYFGKFNPSSENIAYYIFMHLSRDSTLRSMAPVVRVNVWENNTCSASYFESV